MMKHTQPTFDMFAEEVAVAGKLREMAAEVVEDATYGDDEPIADWATEDASALYQAARLLDPSS